MLTEALTALASTGGTALVTAMVTDSWEEIKARFARLFGRGDTAQVEAAAERLEQSRSLLAGLSGPDLERVRAEQEIIWRTRLCKLLDQDPSSEAELQALIAEGQAPVVWSAGRVEQHAAAFDQAQQVIQGHGVQKITFGGHGGPDTNGRLSRPQRCERAAVRGAADSGRVRRGTAGSARIRYPAERIPGLAGASAGTGSVDHSASRAA